MRSVSLVFFLHQHTAQLPHHIIFTPLIPLPALTFTHSLPLQIVYTVGDSRGWWDPIKDRMPSISIPGFGGYKSYCE